MATTALITGATGLIGSHVAEALASHGTKVRALVRPSSDTALLRAIGASLVPGDLSDHDGLTRACDGADVVFHAAAQLGEWAPRPRFVELNVTAVAAMVEACARAGVRRLIHVSSVAVYGRMAHRAITEGMTAPATGHPYMDTKAEGELVALEAGRRLKVEVVIIRPCLVYGPRDRHFLPPLVKNLERGRMVLVGTGHHRANTVYAGTVADLCLRAATHPRAPGEAFNVADPDPLTWRELTTAIALRIGCHPPRRSVPTKVAYAVGGLMEVAARAIGSAKPPPMTRFVAGALGWDLGYSCAKAEDALGFRPRFTVRDGLALSLPEARSAVG